MSGVSEALAPERDEAQDERLLAEIEALLGSGLETEAEPRAETHEMVQEVVGRLQRANADDLRAKLQIAGFTLEAIEVDEIEQACETCMYYLVHRRFCELPELMLPVKPEWSCRLWRI